MGLQKNRDFMRPQGHLLLNRLREPHRKIQILIGARQVGKTTLIRQCLKKSHVPHLFFSIDKPGVQNVEWIERKWEEARLKIRAAKKPGTRGYVLVLDEIQKIPQWSDMIKHLWDKDTANRVPLKVVLLGSSPLLLGRGMSESLSGRFELINLPHWSWQEIKKAFGILFEEYIYYGAYPGAIPFISDPDRWSKYIQDSLIETTLSRDILSMQNINKPALLRQLFSVACAYSGQIVSFNKMLGQLHDAGNTTTLAGYLQLFEKAEMLTGLQKYTPSQIRKRGSLPKFQVLNTALMTAPLGLRLSEVKENKSLWGRIVESSIGAYIINSKHTSRVKYKVFYWRESNNEIDFVILTENKKLISIEVKSHLKKIRSLGLSAFSKKFKPYRQLVIGGEDGIPVEEFLTHNMDHWII